MESFEPHSSHTKCISSRRLLPSSTSKDLWSALRHGPVTEVESALLTLKKNGGNVDSRNASGVTPLHIAVWRNHVPIVKRLLAAGADPDARDGESGWSSLHRALHFGHLAVASVLMQAGASLTVEDTKCRTPVDLLSGPVSQVVGNNLDSVVTELYSWGSGTNYQLGTGNAHIQKLPGKVDVLHDSYIKIIAASKFHSIAVGSNGELYTWGFGRGGRLGHPDFDVHSGQAAVITPRLVTSGLGSRRVKAVAAAKHHTVIATDTGDVFSWGSNREGQLGYTSVDTQPTPRRVSFFKVRIVAVAAANKHSAAVAESGEIFTWGCNKEGQLGYGTSNSASNYTPRIVEYLKGKTFKGVSAAKYHTIVLSAEGEVFTWGHRLVNPRRVIITRSLKKCGAALLKFHRTERLHVILVAAGMTYSTALTEDGALFYWASSDPDLRCEQLHSLCGRHVVGISSGKYWTSAVTATGDVYIWDGKKCKSGTPVLTRLPGIKHAISACVGETHLLAVCSLYHPAYLPSFVPSHQAFMPKENNDGLDDIDEEFLFDDIQPIVSETDIQNQNEVCNTVPTLKSLCERVAAEFLVEPRNAIQLLEIADSLEAENLRRYCEDLVVRNFDYIFTVSAPSIGSASLEVLARLEKLLDARSSEPWCCRRLPTATATFPAIIYSEEDDKNEIGSHVPRINRKFAPRDFGDFSGESFLQRKNDVDQAILKQVRALRKKLQQIEMLESKLQLCHILDDQQIEKLQTRSAVEIALAELGFPCKMNPTLSMSDSSNEKGNKMVNSSKKQRRKSLQNVAHSETAHFNNELHKEEIMMMGGFSDEKSLVSKSMENMTAELSHESKNVGLCSSNGLIHDSHNNKTVRSVSTKKKNKKGGLSMFLSGALDETPKSVPPPAPKSEGPAWGGAKLEKGLASLRDIQNEQSGTKEASIKPKENREGLIEGMAMAGHVKLSSFLPGDFSSPIPVKLTQAAPASESSDKRAPRWSSSGTSSCRPSLRNIQMQQEKQQQSITISKSPKSNAPGSSAAPHGSPSELGSSRWFKPEAEALSSIRSIQIEEKAMKDLKRFYSSVRLLKAQPQPL